MNEQVVTYSDSVRQEAESYIQAGLPIIPICSPTHKGMSETHCNACKSPGKAPTLPGWTSHKETTIQELQNWLSQSPHMNVGIPLGQISGMVGVDIDGETGEQMLRDLSKGDAPATWEFSTGRGRRLLYKIPEGIKTRKWKLGGKEEHEELAFICDGQQTVLPPSIHANGAVYKWKTGRGPEDMDIAIAPQWIIKQVTLSDLSEGLDSTPPELKPIPGRKLSEEDWAQDVPDGQRHDKLLKLAGNLVGRGDIPEGEIITFLRSWNQRHCKPPIPEVEIAPMVKAISLSEQMKISKRATASRRTPGKIVYRPTPVIKWFLKQQQEQGYLWKYSTEMGCFFRCDATKGPWKRLDFVYVQGMVRNSLLDESKGGHKEWDSIHHVGEGVEALKAMLASDKEERLFDLGYSVHANYKDYRPMDIICAENGVLYWRELQLKEWTPSIYTTLELPVHWDPDADCPLWKQVLSEWIPYPNTIQFLQEYIGLCLIPDTSFRTAVFLYGTGANGKSMFLEAVRTLFGDALVAIPLHRLTNRFETANLQNRLVNMCGDIDMKYMADTGIVKSIIGGDVLRGEFKHGKSFDFLPVCRLMFSSNSLPRVADKSIAWYSRWKFIEFPKMFKIDPAYKIKTMRELEKEKPGILRWAVEGLCRLKQQNRWTASEGMEVSEDDYRRENDNVLAFAEECLERVPHKGEDTTVSSSALHGLYYDWIECNMEGSLPVGLIEFAKRMVSLGYTKARRPIAKKTAIVFLGLKPRSEYEATYKMYERARRSEYGDK